MFAAPGLAALVLLIYIKPQEFVPGMAGLPLLYIFLGLTVFGLLIDLKLGYSRLDAPPHWPYIVAFVPWCLVTQLVNIGAGRLVNSIIELAIVVTLFLVLSLGTRSFRVYELTAGALLLASMFVAFVGFHQGFAPLGCAVLEGAQQESLRSDGRPCHKHDDCYSGDAEPGASYRCEREGLFGTVSVGNGRVRYRGVLKDPNEVALAVGAALPLLIARVSRSASVVRIAQLLIGAILIAVAIVFTQSRGGTLVFLAVIGVYFIKKYGVKGGVIGAMMGLPLLLLGGRSGAEAEDSADERSEALVEGFNMLRSSPIFGVGYQRFTDHHHLTAHNTYVLAFAELGIPGFVLFAFILYLAFKIPILAMKRYAGREDAKVAYTWSLAIFAAMCGVVVGSFFLSFTYHQVLWIYLGFSGGLYAAIRSHDPQFKVSTGIGEKLIICAVSVIFPVALRAFLITKGK